jgi:hypothetical protein
MQCEIREARYVRNTLSPVLTRERTEPIEPTDSTPEALAGSINFDVQNFGGKLTCEGRDFCLANINKVTNGPISVVSFRGC